MLYPCGPIFTKLPPNRGVCVRYVQAKVECSACDNLGVIANQGAAKEKRPYIYPNNKNLGELSKNVHAYL